MASNPYGFQSSHVSYANGSVGMAYTAPYQAPPSPAMYNPAPGFAFKKRFERVDWRKIAAADIDNISRSLDFHSLQENVSNITFCNIESELDMRTIDPNFVKLFKLAQMTIEYLLHSQDYLSGVVVSLEEKLRTVMKEHEETKNALTKTTNDLVEVKRESHKRKKLLMTQQQMIQTGPSSYNKCPQCSKAFINTSFLNAHITRRHPECIGQLVPVLGQGAPSIPQPANSSLERQLLDIQQRLMQTEAQLVEERNERNANMQKERNQKIMEERNIEDDLGAWKLEQQQQHRREMEKMRDTFMKELAEMHEKNSASETAVQKLQRKLARQSGLGQLEDDDVVDDNKHALKKQHQEMTCLKEQMQQQVAKVEQAMSEKFLEQEQKWQMRLDAISQCHKEELEQAVNVSTVELRKMRQEQGEMSDSYKHKKQELEQLLQQQEAERVRRLQQEKEMAQQQQTRAAAAVPRKEVTTVTTMTYKTQGLRQSDSMEETSEEEETDNVIEQTTGDATTTFGTMTLPTLGTETLSLRETKKTHLLDQMKRDPNFLENMKQQLRNVLDEELVKRGIPAGTERLSNSVYQNKLALLKNERQKKAKRYPTIYDIRQQHINMIEQQAKQELKKRFGSPKPSAARSPSRGWSSAPNTPQMKAGHDGAGARVPPIPAPRTASPGAAQNTMMATASTFSSPRGQQQLTARTASSSQWDSDEDDDDDDDDEDDDDDIDGKAVDAITASHGVARYPQQGASKYPQSSGANRRGVETIGDNDDWDSSEPVSPDATNHPTQPLTQTPTQRQNTNLNSNAKVVLRQPRGRNVAALAKEIDYKLNMRSSKKLAGAVNTLPGGQDQTGSMQTKGSEIEDDLDDELESISSIEDLGSELPSPARKSVQPQARRSIPVDTSSSTNTYGTSAWGSSRAPSSAPPHPSRQSVGKSSLFSVSDLDDDL